MEKRADTADISVLFFLAVLSTVLLVLCVLAPKTTLACLGVAAKEFQAQISTGFIVLLGILQM